MSAKRSRPGSPAVRTGSTVGPDYPNENFTNPWNVGISSYSGDETSKTLHSPTSTPEGVGIELHHTYDKNWEGK